MFNRIRKKNFVSNSHDVKGSSLLCTTLFPVLGWHGMGLVFLASFRFTMGAKTFMDFLVKNNFSNFSFMFLNPNYFFPFEL
jgi:hypothetical protein